jgi:hypothetical protein
MREQSRFSKEVVEGGKIKLKTKYVLDFKIKEVKKSKRV